MQVVACAMIAVVGHALIMLIPESPRYLISKGDTAGAMDSLAWLHRVTPFSPVLNSYMNEVTLFQLLSRRAGERGVFSPLRDCWRCYWNFSWLTWPLSGVKKRQKDSYKSGIDFSIWKFWNLVPWPSWFTCLVPSLPKSQFQLILLVSLIPLQQTWMPTMRPWFSEVWMP